MSSTVKYVIEPDEKFNSFPKIYRVIEVNEVEVSRSLVVFEEVVLASPDTVIGYLAAYKLYVTELANSIPVGAPEDLLSKELISCVRLLMSSASYVGEYSNSLEFYSMPPASKAE
jgi:hypothetical protein